MSVNNKKHPIVSDQGGNAAVEFAMIGPLLIVLIAAIFSTGWVMHSVSSVRYALEEVGRTLLVDPNVTEAQLTTLVTNRLGQLSNQNVTVTLTLDAPLDGIRLAQATAAVPIKFEVPMLPSFSMTFNTSATIALTPPP